MRRLFVAATLAALALLLTLDAGGRANRTVALTVRVSHTFGDAPLRPGAGPYLTRSGQDVTVTRLAYLISNVALIRPDGTKIPLPLPDRAAYLNPFEGRTRFSLSGVPAGRYAGLSFQVGLPPSLNHASPSHYPSGHPLNPLVNGLHWGWQGGYVFLAMEGGYTRPGGERGGYSYHLGTDRLRMTVTRRFPLTLDSDRRLDLRFDTATLLPKRISDKDGTDSTHSRPGDGVAERLADRVTRAFTVRGVERDASSRAAPPALAIVHSSTTPYPFHVPEGFPQPSLPPDNPLTLQGVALGKKLFSEKRLSGNDTQSCADCHRAEYAFSDGGNALSRGIDGKTGDRNAMPLFNLAWSSGAYTWDGGKRRLRDQALAPIQNEREMRQSLPETVAKLKEDPAYPRLFAQAFGNSEITSERIGRAIEQYLLTLVAADSRFDRAMRGEATLTDQEKRGLLLFLTEYDPSRGQFGGDCFHCHGGSLFTDYRFHDDGLEAVYRDPGRYLITHDETDRGKFKTPSLRNVELTAPYMHDGRFRTLEEVVAHYCGGVHRSDNLDPNLAKHPDGGIPLPAEDQKALVAFLKTLTEERLRRK